MMKITPTQKQMIYRFHVNAEKKDNAQDINLTYTEKQRFKISKAYISFFFFYISFNETFKFVVMSKSMKSYFYKRYQSSFLCIALQGQISNCTLLPHVSRYLS